MSRSLRAGVGVSCLVAVLSAIAAVAPGASSRSVSRTSSISVVTFLIQQPAHSEMGATFTGGISNITEQAAGGTSMIVFTAFSDGFVFVAGSAENGGSLIINGQLTSGTPITGTASVPAGATMSASVNDGPKQTINNGAFSIATPTSLGAAPGVELNVTPGKVRPGRQVRVFGNVADGCARGDAVTLLSRAFTNTYSFAGLPAIYATVGSNGAFSVKTTIPATRKAGSYEITGRCGGGNLGVVVPLRVLKK